MKKALLGLIFIISFSTQASDSSSEVSLECTGSLNDKLRREEVLHIGGGPDDPRLQEPRDHYFANAKPHKIMKLNPLFDYEAWVKFEGSRNIMMKTSSYKVVVSTSFYDAKKEKTEIGITLYKSETPLASATGHVDGYRVRLFYFSDVMDANIDCTIIH
jgi:hypothetical protein